MQVGAIIITPTRELAIQIDEVLSHFTKHFPMFRWVNLIISTISFCHLWTSKTLKMTQTFLFYCFSQILLIGGRNPMEDVEKFKEHGWVVCLSVSQSCAFLLVRGFSPELWSCWCWNGVVLPESFGVSWEIVGSVPGVGRGSYVTSAPFICCLGEEQSWKVPSVSILLLTAH